MEGITIAEIERLRMQNKNLNDLLEWRNGELRRSESMLRVSKNNADTAFKLIDIIITKIGKLNPELVKEFENEAMVLESYKRYKSLG